MDRGGRMLFSGSIRWAFAALLGVLVLSSIAFRASVAALNVYLRKEPVALRESFDTIPTKLGRWRRVGQDGRMGDAMTESLGTNQYLDRHYALDGDSSKGVLLLHIAYYTGMVDAVPHVPERCWGAA
ncbi:MAG: exosortase-associated EpsI family protein, partial [Phycisphaerae bacterium]|nr:exosortase-associated EpsI family protein [Phycisphaerae bacterium]